MRKPLSALVIEDCEDDALLIVHELGEQGFDVEWERVCTAAATRSNLEAKAWDVVLSDYTMPGFDAPAALRLLQETLQDLPFIVISGSIGEEAAVAMMKNGAHDYLQKDNLKRLGAAIERETRDAGIRHGHRRAIEKTQHLNRMLRAIRKVNQLIVTEEDPTRLIEQTCDLLVETRGYAKVMIALTDGAHQPSIVAHSLADGGDRQMALDAIHNEGLPGCMQQALGSTDPVVVKCPAPDCGDCLLHSAQSDRQLLAMGLAHHDRSLGVISVTLPQELTLSAEELDLFAELVDDVSFALHGIELKTERKNAEGALRQSEARYHDFYDNAPNAYFSVSASDDTIQNCNLAGGRLLGVDVQEIIGKKALDLFADTPLGKEAAAKVLEGVRKGEELHVVELQMERADGSLVDVDLSVFPKEDATGAVVESRLIVSDITERKQMQAQVAQSDRLSCMGMLAAGVAHEINNPLSYVIYNLESLTDDLPRLSSAVRKCLGIVVRRFGNDEWARLIGPEQELLSPSMLDDIHSRLRDALHGSNRIKGIARGLGTFSRVGEDSLEPVNLRSVIEVAVNMAFNEMRHRAQLVKEYGKISRIMASDGRLSQVFLNLLVNAAHSIQEGDVENNEIRVRTWQEGDEVFAEVRDTGKGVSEKHLPHLFEPFFTTKETGAGTGLGLAISKKIVEGYGGHIEVSSEVGVGTSFVICLPVNEAEEQAETTQIAQAPIEPELSGRILVIDDEAAIRRAMGRMLKGYEVVEAESGAEAQKILETDQLFDLLLCDLMMPAMSGMDLHRWLSTAHPTLADKVVFITGGAFTPKARDYLARVSNIRLEKPFEMANVKKIVGELIRSSRR